MIEGDFEVGIVTSVSDRGTLVELKPGEVCESCSARLFCRPGKSGRHEMLVQNAVGAKTGDMVELAETRNLLLTLSFFQYGLPLLGLLLGIFAIYAIQPMVGSIRMELLMSMAGFIGLLLGGIAANLGIRSISSKTGLVFKIIAVRG